MKIHAKILFSLLSGLLLAGCFHETQYVHVGPNWARLHDFQEGENSFKVSIVSAPKQVEVGKPMQFTVSSAKAGQLWVVQVDPKDELSLLFPNQLQRENRIEANKPLTLPGEGWSLEAAEPAGPSAMAFFVTPEGVSLQDVLEGGENSKRMEKAIRIVAEAPSWGLVKTVVDVVEPKE
ncbi:MAG: DUF4384 domain-containing protein [Gammaproteobacteria bacterium]|nr:DUF4384 domain-containing protein [Gammaproteobacteria bacterium]MBU1655489.1 DUF4384 domain-containing protein [Gammaproteobacteria bacterium]MBU1962263.1 DUF4384 domain-containing protein [Gammaproteobacteria bacterium]